MVDTWSGNPDPGMRPASGPTPPPEQIRDAVLRKFMEQDDCPPDWPGDWRPQGAPMVRRESTICRLGSPSSGKSICVKIVHPKPSGSENSGKLFAALRHYHAKSDTRNGYTVAQPYGWVPEHRAVIMEWVDGRNFNEILKREWLSPRKRHDRIRKAAGWLRWFHTQSELEPATLAKQLKLKNIVTIFGQEVGSAAMAHDSELLGYLEIARNASKRVQTTPMDLVDLHGDFKPTNLLVASSGAVVGIDFKGDGRGAPVHDICRFLSDLDFHRNVVGRSFALEPRSEANDFEVFLNSYGGRMTELDRDVFTYLYFLTTLRGLVHQRKKFIPSALFRMRQAVVRRLAGKLSREVSRTLLLRP